MKRPIRKNESFLSDLSAKFSLLKLYGNDLLGRSSSSLDDVGDLDGERTDEKNIIDGEGDFIGNTDVASSDSGSSKLGFVFWVFGIFSFAPAILHLIGGDFSKSAAFAGCAMFCLVVATVLNFLALIAGRLERINNTVDAVLTSVKNGRE